MADDREPIQITKLDIAMSAVLVSNLMAYIHCGSVDGIGKAARKIRWKSIWILNFNQHDRMEGHCVCRLHRAKITENLNLGYEKYCEKKFV